MRVAVSGAQGFVGTALCALLKRQGHEVREIGRPGTTIGLSLDDAPGWLSRMRGVDALVHLAARAHITSEAESDPLSAFRRVNVEGTRCIAGAASAAGVRRFVFASSIGVFGVARNDVLSEQSSIDPQEPYAISKWEAEQALHAIAHETGMQLVVVRPTLVYGPHVKGNFLRLMRLVASGVPLPFGSVVNARSFIGLANLCDLMHACVVDPSAAGQTFVAADGEDISTSALLTLISEAMGRPDRQFRLPLPLLRTALTAVGLKKEFFRMTSSLLVDAAHARATLQWQPQTSLKQGIEEMVHAFMGRSPR